MNVVKINVSLTDEQFKAFEALLVETGLSKSALFRLALIQYLKNRGTT